jgi:radical SAM-linked protein
VSLAPKRATVPTDATAPAGAAPDDERGEGNAEEWLDAPLSAVHAAPNGSRTQGRVRMQYTKRGRARFIGSRELAELFYRATRRAGIPVAFSEGFHPLPRLSFGPGLPVGFASDGEFMDLDLAETLPADTVAARLDAQLPEGLQVIHASVLPLDAQRIEPAIRSFRYDVELPRATEAVSDAADRIAAYNASPTYLVRKRAKNGTIKAIDVRPTTSLRLSSPQHLEIEIQCSPDGTIQPTALAAALFGLDDDTMRGLRVTKVATVFRDTPDASSSTVRATS